MFETMYCSVEDLRGAVLRVTDKTRLFFCTRNNLQPFSPKTRTSAFVQSKEMYDEIFEKKRRHSADLLRLKVADTKQEKMWRHETKSFSRVEWVMVVS